MLLYMFELMCFYIMGYSRKKSTPPNIWQDFLTPPPSTRISGTTRPPLLPGFPSPKTPLPPGFSLISLEALILIESQWKRHKVQKKKIFLLFLKTLVHIFAKLISIILYNKHVTFERACSSLNATCLFSTPHQIHRIRNI